MNPHFVANHNWYNELSNVHTLTKIKFSKKLQFGFLAHKLVSLTMDKFMIIRARHFTEEELVVIKKIAKRHFKKGRTFISREICQTLNWRQPNGWLKDRACRDVLQRLEKDGYLKLPKPKIRKTLDVISEKNIDFVFEPIRTCGVLSLCFAKGNKLEKLWNQIVSKYHYLGHSVIVGKCIKYLIYSDNYLIGAISYSSPVKNIIARKYMLEEIGIAQDEIEKKIINNNRFLILPHVSVKNLASQILSIASQKVKEDWLNYYLLKPEIIETFVQISKYEGTCYKAANWKYIGSTKGYSKRGNIYYANNEPKHIYVYGLTKQTKKMLKKISIPKKVIECRA
ncbi:MAG: Druantia anti-phage system protein DruA [Bacteriovorax sp.]